MSQPKGVAHRRVLIIDDSKFVRTTFNRILSASFAVREEADGEAGWEALCSDPSISLVFTDLDMPKLDGYGLIERIRKSDDARVSRLPVVVISGGEGKAPKKRALDAGANDFISKNADAPEVLARIDNLMRLVMAKDELQASRQLLERTGTRDPLTGTATRYYLLTEGAQLFSYARRHNGQLSVMALRIESYPEVARKVSKDVADQILVRIAKTVSGVLRAEDSIGRIADATFVVISAGTGAPQVLAFARRLRDQLDNAKVTYAGQVLKLRPSFGLASMGVDPAGSIEELIKAAMQRLERWAEQAAAMASAPPAPPKAAAVPPEVERALQVLESLERERLGGAMDGVLKRLARILEKARKELLTL